MIESALSTVASTLLEEGVSRAFQPRKVDLTRESIEKIRRIVRETARDGKLARLRALVDNVRTYRNTPSQDLLVKTIRHDAGEVSSSLRTDAWKYHNRYTYQPYHLAKSIYVWSFRENYEKYGAAKGERVNLAEKAIDALHTLLAIETHESDSLDFDGWARFKRYTIEGGKPTAVVQDAPQTRDLMNALGHRYYHLVRGFQKALQGKEEYESQIPEPRYVCRYLQNDKPALRTAWIDQGLWDPPGKPELFQVRPDHRKAKGYYPVGDTAFGEGFTEARLPRRALFVKPLHEAPVLKGRWRLLWEDASADKEDEYRGGPWSIWEPNEPGRHSLGSRIENEKGARSPKGRILLFPVSDLTSKDLGLSILWNDMESGADKDVQLWRPVRNAGDDPRPGHSPSPAAVFVATPTGEDRPAYWLKKGTLGGYVRLGRKG